MEGLVKGDVIVLPFPFSDLTNSVKRPAIVITNLQGDDLILSQITSEAKNDNYSISLEEKDFEKGKLNLKSIIRPNKIFTADKSIILYKVGNLKKQKINQLTEKLIEIIKK